MLNKSAQNIVIALFTGAVLIGLAFYERFRGPHHVSEVTFYISAAVILVSAVVYRLLLCKGCGNKSLKAG
jgi:Co/Zn/Cd efflux system component